MDKEKAKEKKKEKKIKVVWPKTREFLTVRKCTGCEERKYQSVKSVYFDSWLLFQKSAIPDTHFSRAGSESHFCCGTFEPYEIYELRKRHD
jgi:hypothetical protein